MRVEGVVALVTGAGRGLRRAFACELVRRGAATVYGAARDPGAVTTLVVAVHASFIDTGMAAGFDAPKVSPASVARQVKASLPRDHELIYPPVQAAWDHRDDGTPGGPARQ